MKPKLQLKLLIPFDEFDWDEYNKIKNWEKHKVTSEEAEQAFFDEQVVIFADNKHVLTESRFFLLGKTKDKRLLYVAFTVRKNKIRVISARDISKKREGKLYEKET